MINNAVNQLDDTNTNRTIFLPYTNKNIATINTFFKIFVLVFYLALKFCFSSNNTYQKKSCQYFRLFIHSAQSRSVEPRQQPARTHSLSGVCKR